VSASALTYAFADEAGGLCGIARLGLSDGGASGLVLLFRGGEPVVVRADGDGAGAERVEDVRAAGLASEEAGGRWTLRFDGELPFALEFDPVAPPFAVSAESAVGRAGGMEAGEWFCQVAGTVGGAPFHGFGQRGTSSGEPDWSKMALARTVTAWFDETHAISLAAIRAAKAKSHADEAVTAFVLGEDGTAEVGDARLSTTYDSEGRQRAAGLELYIGAEDEFPVRAAGDVVAGTTLDLGRLRLECAFFRWRMHGRVGVGRYDVLRRAD
jgi:hypothetical protein